MNKLETMNVHVSECNISWLFNNKIILNLSDRIYEYNKKIMLNFWPNIYLSL